MIILKAPNLAWVGLPFSCRECGAVVAFEKGDQRDRAFTIRQAMDGTWTARARCAECHNPIARFVQEVPMPVPIKDDAQTLAPCVLCGRGYLTKDMWPRPDGHICDECSMKVPDDAQ